MHGTFDLSPAQKKKVAALKKAYKDCIRAAMLPVNIYGQLTFYDRSMVAEYGNEDSIKYLSHLHPFSLHGDSRSSNFVNIENEWTDDAHIAFLTDKGLKNLED